MTLYEERLLGDKYQYSGLVVCEEIQKIVVVVLWTGKCVKKNRTEGGGGGGGGGALDGKMCEEKQDRRWWWW